jgi:hypothetical protein
MNSFYWWCPKCKDNVDIYVMEGHGVWCLDCLVTKVVKPTNRPDPKLIPEEYDEEDEDLPDPVIDPDEVV